jgi:hypothetical protein
LRELLTFTPPRARDAGTPERFEDYSAHADIAAQHPL